ncbi:hypothetical protein L6164_023523 [Bauhinia variegata]|uniref:Uncharacterized protein n=1 Tax=Bauhinia variegata TaxID=167791 RepID=A0ACB9MIH1_BAUVA|nr:hypothetical protein L6164_023523 [Bauhinia variegata]
MCDEIDDINVTFPSDYRYYDDFNVEDALTTSDLMVRGGSRMRGPRAAAVEPTVMGSVDDPIVVEVVDISLTPATKLMDQGALNLPMHVPPLMSMASTLEESSTAFNDSPEGRACYPLSRRKVKSTTRKDRRRPVAASSGSDSELAGATGTNSEGALMGVPTTGLDGSDNASPLGGCSGTGSSHERPPIPPLFEGFGARGSSGAACGVPAPKEVAEESAAEAKQQALAAEEKIATIKRDLDTTRKEVANAEERASTAAS